MNAVTLFRDLIAAIKEAVREWKRRAWLRHRREQIKRDPSLPF